MTQSAAGERESPETTPSKETGLSSESEDTKKLDNN